MDWQLYLRQLNNMRGQNNYKSLQNVLQKSCLTLFLLKPCVAMMILEQVFIA